MLVSLNWIRDYVDLPADLDTHDLAERFTRTAAEVDGVNAITVAAKGLIAARITQTKQLPDTRNLSLVTLDVGGGKLVETVSAAPALRVDTNVVYAPLGAGVAKLGEINLSKIAGHQSTGMILPGDALGVAMAPLEAIVLSRSLKPGEALAPELFDDWVIDIDNKSITHRPDLWGHYGIAREVAAIYGTPLKPYSVVPLNELGGKGLPTFPITIADSSACRRYSGLLVEGVPTQPGPLWLQLRLGHVGMRPLSGLVDLTNYVMADLGQPMHAFDAAKVDRIEVDWAKDGERFTALDGMERKLTAADLMIQSGGRSVALAGVIGGLESEVTPNTTTLLLESANFDPATIRRTSSRLGLRTDAGARFEKSLDPAHTVLAIQRFMFLAGAIYPDMKITGRLSDAYPTPHEPVTVTVDASHVARTIGREVPFDECARILKPLGFGVDQSEGRLSVAVPSYRATNDISIEADVVEEIARYIGYNNIPVAMPRVSIRRFEPHALHELEQRTLDYFTSVHAFHEIQGYSWYDSAWLAQLGVDSGPCVVVRNPAADGLHRLRRSLLPGMLAATARNRFHFPAFSLIELGSVFEPGDSARAELRHAGLVTARRGKRVEDDLFMTLKGAIEAWGRQRFSRTVSFLQAPADSAPWQHPKRTAEIHIDGRRMGTISVVPLSLRRAMDEHLEAWGIAWATLRLSDLEQLDVGSKSIDGIPEFPLIEMDFSVLVPQSDRYRKAAEKLAAFRHPLLRSMRFVATYDGDAIPRDMRSLTFRVVVGDATRTLVEQDAAGVRREFEKHVAACGYKLRM